MAKKNIKKNKVAKSVTVKRAAVKLKKHVKLIKSAKVAAKQVKKPVKIARKKEAKAESAMLINVNNTEAINEFVQNSTFSGYITTNVGEGAMAVVKQLVESPQTDEKLAEVLSMKINDVRRMLNMMNSSGILRYDVNKDGKGWLIFKWRIDSEKLAEFIYKLENPSKIPGSVLQENCNDFFMCKTCYPTEKVILPFDTAFENNFSCNCGKRLDLLNRNEAEELFKQTAQIV